MKKRLSIILSTICLFIMPVYASIQVSEDAVPSKNGPFDQLVQMFEGSYFYRRYVSSWPEPLNNASFDIVILIIIALALIWAIYGIIMNIIWRVRYKKLRKAYNNYLDSNPDPVLGFSQWILANKGKVPQTVTSSDQSTSGGGLGGVVAGVANKISEAREDAAIDRELDKEEKEKLARKKAEAEEQARIAALDKDSSDKATEPVNTPASPKTKAEEILDKYNKAPDATELVDLENSDDIVSIAESSIVRPVEPKKEEKKEVKEEPKQIADVAKLMEEKVAENHKQEKVETLEQKNTFAALIAAIDEQKASDEKAKETEKARNKMFESNLEVLKSDFESDLAEDKTEKTGKSKDTDDSALTAAQKEAIRQREKERIRAGKRGKK